MAVKIVLLTYDYAHDDIGVDAPTEKETECYAIEESIFQSEHTQAAQKGFTAEARLSVWQFEYNGAKRVRYKDRVLEIYRTYNNLKSGRVELYAGERISGYEQY